MRIAAATLLVVVALDAPGVAQIYKWVDEKGTVHFSDDPPASAPAEVIQMPTPRPQVQRDARPEESQSQAVEEEAPADDQRAQPEPLDSAPLVVEESDTIIVDDGRSDLVTEWRANSPRNRPGQPIRQPVRRPRRVR